MPADVRVGLLQGDDEPECCLFATLTAVVLDRLFHIPAGQFARDDWFGLQPRALDFARPRTRRRSALK